MTVTISGCSKKTKRNVEGIEYDFDSEKKKVLLEERKYFTHQLYKKIFRDKEIQGKIKKTYNKSVSQEMTREIINTICTQSELNTYSKHYPNLFNLLQLPTIPDWKIGWGLKNWNLNIHEKHVADFKYQFARDMKYLQFATELLWTVHKIEENEFFEFYKTQSDIEIILTSKNNNFKTLLNPINRKKKKQIKDRIFEITIGDKQYILKEQKSSKHFDTMKNGHRPWVSSKEEMSIAIHLNEKHSIIDKERSISLHWEKPIGSVTFPDWFQWCVFEKWYWLDTYSNELLIERIINNKEQFLLEYNNISKKLQKNIDFEEYAKIKADYMYRSLSHEKEKQMILAWYKALDGTQWNYRIWKIQNMVFLDFFWYDFEYTSKAWNKDAIRMLEKEKIRDDVAQWLYKFDKQSNLVHSLTWNLIDPDIFWYFSSLHTKIEKEIFLAIFNQDYKKEHNIIQLDELN